MEAASEVYIPGTARLARGKYPQRRPRQAGRSLIAMTYDDRLAQRIRRILPEDRSVEEKRMFGGLAFMVNGHMCCGIVGEDLVVRVGADQNKDALSDPNARPMDFTGRPMKGFVFVSPAGYRSPTQLRHWIQRGLRFVVALPAKPRR